MPRRAAAVRREVMPDAVYNNRLVTQLINKVLLDGKKSNAERIVYGAFDIVKEKTDGDPLATCKNLRHLNIAFNFTVTDITPLYELTDLERLWIGALDPVPREQVAEMQRRAPNCQIDLESRDPTGGDWRYISFYEWGGAQLHPRYALLREQFDYGSNPWCYNYIESDPLYYPHG